MAIARNPKKHPKDQREEDAIAEAFIAKAVKPSPKTQHPTEDEALPPGRRKRILRHQIGLRFHPTLLAQIDAAAERRGVTRTAWIHMVISRALDAGEG